ncbi:MAG: hypothetical protein ACRDXX_10890 [Stackebrandtia sp.]
MVSLIRTWVPAGIGAALASAATYGVEITGQEQAGLVAGLTAACISTYYALVRAGEARFPWLGYLLGTKHPPAYASPELDSDLDD